MSVAAIIPARAGSKGLQDKNAIRIAGVPMVVRAIGAVRSAGPAISRIIVSTDSSAVAKVSMDAGGFVVERPADLAGDTAGVEGAARHALRALWPEGDYPEFTLIVQPNLPVWQPGIVQKVVQRLAQGDCTGAGTCFLVDQRPEWMKKVTAEGFTTPFLPAENTPIRRQDFPEIYYFDGAVLGMKTEVLMASEGQSVSHLYFMGERIVPIARPEVYGMEVHAPEDIPRAEIAIAWLDKVGYPQ
jgi:CMP-N-acetylneuraminic acid synthetase